MTHPTTLALDALEAAIARAGFDFYLVPMADEFQGEYTPAAAARLPHVTGFTGSAGMGIFRPQGGHALLVDGRYVLQAPEQVDRDRIAVVNSADTSTVQWIKSQAKKGLVGFDPWLVTPRQLERWKEAAPGFEWQSAANLIDPDWVEREAWPSAKAVLQPLERTGTSTEEKKGSMLEKLRERGGDALLFTAADSINWLLNIRGADIEFNPLLLGYLLLKADGAALLYTFPREWDAPVAEYLRAEKVEVAPIADVFAGAVDALPAGASLLADFDTVPQGWAELAQKKQWKIAHLADPAQLPKAIKSGAEREGMRAAHRRDGAALAKFLAWFDGQAHASRLPNELEIADRLEGFRAEDAEYRGPSFATIAGSGPNGAIVHYRADAKSNRALRRGELLLLDSGGQYAGGTTDVTRTIYLPLSAKEGKDIRNATAEHAEMKDRFTRVLKGHIALASAQFPEGTAGIQLDALARQFLWAAGLDYDHGTGHGVGAYLCVHEGPQRIGKKGSDVALKPGMILSNEPGYYKAGAYGIRIESLVEVVERGESEGRRQLGFETLTLAPIDTRLVDVSMLTSDERNWLNAYHRRVFHALEGGLNESARGWLLQATRAV